MYVFIIYSLLYILHLDYVLYLVCNLIWQASLVAHPRNYTCITQYYTQTHTYTHTLCTVAHLLLSFMLLHLNCNNIDNNRLSQQLIKTALLTLKINNYFCH